VRQELEQRWPAEHQQQLVTSITKATNDALRQSEANKSLSSLEAAMKAMKALIEELKAELRSVRAEVQERQTQANCVIM
jgi:predicted RNase H-like nuclease (RuvC/YqgF family)